MKRFIKKYLLENWILKTTALLLALILWLFVRGEPGPERVVAVPLEVQLPRLMEITNDRPSTIEITMRGPAYSNILFSQPSLPTCIVDLQGAKEGEHFLTLTPENVRIPQGSGIEVLQVNPSRIRFVLERTISKEVPITVPVQGELPQGYEVYSKSWKPTIVLVTGPRSQIETERSVPTETVSLTDLKQSARFFVRLNPGKSSIRTAINDPVQVDIVVGPRRKLHTVRRVPVAADDPAYAVIPKSVSVQVLAAPEAIEQLTPENIKAIVETENLDLSNLPVKAKPVVGLPDNLGESVVIREVQPAEVSVRKAQGR
jgi:hypothetical protein